MRFEVTYSNLEEICGRGGILSWLMPPSRDATACKIPSYLESNVVSESNCGESDKAVVETVKVAPPFVSGEDSCPRCDNNGWQESRGHHQVDLRSLGLRAVQVHLGTAYHHRRDLVESLSDALEHDQAQRYAHHRISHAERLSSNRNRGWVSIT